MRGSLLCAGLPTPHKTTDRRSPNRSTRCGRHPTPDLRATKGLSPFGIPRTLTIRNRPDTDDPKCALRAVWPTWPTNRADNFGVGRSNFKIGPISAINPRTNPNAIFVIGTPGPTSSFMLTPAQIHVNSSCRIFILYQKSALNAATQLSPQTKTHRPHPQRFTEVRRIRNQTSMNLSPKRKQSIWKGSSQQRSG